MRYLSLALAVLLALFPLEVMAQSAQVMLVSPSAGEELSGAGIEIAASYNAGSELVTYVELVIDGKRFAGKYLQTPKSRGVCSFIWDSTGYSNGPHSVIVKLFSGDKLLGSVSGSLVVGNRPIDVIPPKINFHGVKSGDVFKGLREIKLTAQDNSGKFPIVSVSVDKNLKLIKNNPPYSYTWDTTSYEDGQHEVAAWGYDEAGNRGDAGSVNVVVKNGIKTASVNASPSVSVKASSTQAAVETKPVVTKSETITQVKQAEPTVPSISGKTETAPARASVTEPAVIAAKPAAVSVTPSPQQNVQPAAEDTKLALSEPKVEGFANRTAMQAKQSGPNMPRNTQPATAGLREQTIQPAASSSEVAVPAETETVMAMMPSATETVQDPLSLPASRTAPEMRGLSPVMTAMVSTAIPYESPALESDPTLPAMPVMTPHTAHVKSAGSDLKVLETGIESGIKMVAPGSTLMAMAPKPALKSKPSLQTAPKVVKGSVKLVLGENKVTLTSEDGKNSVPAAALRKIMEQLGGLVVWDQDAKTITTYNNGVRITLKVGELKAKVNGKNVKLSAPVTIVDDRAVVDLKFLEKALKMELEYDPKTGAFALVRK